MIRDIAEFRRTGVTCRRIAELNVPVEAWRAAMCRVARQEDARVRTFVVPSTANRTGGRMVFAVRIDPPPDQDSDRGGPVRCWRVDELGMPLHRWRAALHRLARREQARVHTFLVPGTRVDHGPPDQLVYLVWAHAELLAPTAAPPPRSAPVPRPVTNLARYTAAGRRSTGSTADVERTPG